MPKKYMFKTIDEVIDFYFKDWRNLPKEEFESLTRKLWLLIGDLNAFIHNDEETWNRVFQNFGKDPGRKFRYYTFQYVNQEIVLISPSGTIQTVPESDKKSFIDDVDYTIEYKTSENTANEAISDLISKEYW